MRRDVLLVVLALAACGKRTEEPAPAPRVVPMEKPTGPAPVVPAAPIDAGLLVDRDPCATHDVELIYLVDDANHLVRFDPRKLPDDPFELVGTLHCDAGGATPFSMAVDRRGIAWVMYNDGQIFRVSIVDARCSALAYAPEPGKPWQFGMGFATDGAKATTETLYVAARQDDNPFGRLDVAQDPPRYVPIGRYTSQAGINPELSGTGDGKLYGYFPAPGLGYVQELNRASGKPVGPRRSLGGDDVEVGAYAFAHWGGVFYVFAQVGERATSDVHAIHRATGKYELVRENIPYQIVGAGVSTCAPLLERAP